MTIVREIFEEALGEIALGKPANLTAAKYEMRLVKCLRDRPLTRVQAAELLGCSLKALDFMRRQPRFPELKRISHRTKIRPQPVFLTGPLLDWHHRYVAGLL